METCPVRGRINELGLPIGVCSACSTGILWGGGGEGRLNFSHQWTSLTGQ